MSNKIFEENLGGALKFIVRNFGKNSLLDSNHVSEMLSALVPNLSEESKWIKEAIDLGIVEVLLDDKNNDYLNRKIALNKARLMMRKEHISKDRINLILESLEYALGWIKDTGKDDKIKEYTQEDNSNKEKGLNNQGDTSQNNQIQNNISNNHITEDNNKENNINSQDSQQNGNSSNSEKTRNRFLIHLFILIFIGIIGIALFKNLCSNDVYVKEIIFDIDYEKEESTYVFNKGDFIIMNLILDSDEEEEEIDEEKISYVVDDPSICDVSNEFNKCRITGVGVGATTIYIYYDNDKIKSLDVEFRWYKY